MTSSRQPAAHGASRLAMLIPLWGLAAWFAFFSPWEMSELRIASAVMLLLGGLPIVRWSERRENSYPLVETMVLMTVPFYFVPLLTQHSVITRYPEPLVLRAVLCVVLFQISLLAGARLPFVSRPVLQSRRFTEPLLPDNAHAFLLGCLTANTLWLLVQNFTQLVPPTVVGSVRALLFGLGLISSFGLAQRFGEGRCKTGLLCATAINLLAQVILLSCSLLLIQAITLLGVTLLGYFTSARRIPWVPILLAGVLFTVLHNGKSEMRKAYWEEGRPRLTLADIPSFYAEWLDIGWQRTRQSGPEDGEDRRLNLFERASLLQHAAFAIDRVPSLIPHFDGESYADIPLQIVPRFFWPTKPSPNSTVALISVKLGILTAEQAETTSIAYGIITEGYLNFGWLGPLALGLAIGSLLELVARSTVGADTLSVHGLFRILCLAWCLNAEVTLSVWLSSFYQASIAVFLPLLIWQKLRGPF